jgi:hypothetical protein
MENIMMIQKFSLAMVVMLFCIFAQTIVIAEEQDTITQVQSKLSDLGYVVGSIDGLFGPKTRAAIVKFQKDSELAPNGTIDKDTLLQLGLGHLPVPKVQPLSPNLPYQESEAAPGVKVHSGFMRIEGW